MGHGRHNGIRHVGFERDWLVANRWRRTAARIAAMAQEAREEGLTNARAKCLTASSRAKKAR